MKKNLFFCLGFLLIVISFTPPLFAAVCTIDSTILDRGEKKAFIICGTGIPANYTIKGLSEANITIEYEQYLKMCAIGKQNPGIYVILRAEDDALTASISILNAETKEIVCEDVRISVPDRVHIRESVLKEPRDPELPFKILEVKANGTQDLSTACTDGLIFPEGTWPTLSLVSRGDIEEIPPASRSSNNLDQPLTCKKSLIRAFVNVQGQQRYSAKIIIPKVTLKGGNEKEGVAYVRLSPPAWASAMRGEDAKHIDVNGVRTRYFDKGTGDALLLVHGGQAGDGSNSAQSWEQNFDYLSQYFHVYALDRLGQGYTDNPKKEEDYKEYYQQVVDHVYGFIKAVGIKKVHLVGHSQGGWPVTRIALDHPKMVKSLVNVDGSPAPRDPKARFAAFTMYYIYYLHPPEGPTRESIRRGIELWSYSFNNITDKKVEQTYTLSYLPKMIEATTLMTQYGVHPGNPSFLTMQNAALEEIKEGKLKVPTLLIWGYRDSMMHHEVGVEFFKHITSSDVPGSRLVLFDNCDHFPFIEYPELFNRTIKSFCGAYAFKPVD